MDIITMNKADSVTDNDLIYVNDHTNEIHFNSSVTKKSMASLSKELLKLQDKLLKKTKTLKRKYKEIDGTDDESIVYTIEPKPIKLFITSPGGLVYQAFMVIDTMLSMKVPVHTVCKGMVASAGTLISLAGKKRFITEHSYMLIHQISSGMWGKFAEMKDDYDNCKNLMDDIKKYYIKRTKMSGEELDIQLKQDISWNATTCLEKGLVDEIITY